MNNRIKLFRMKFSDSKPARQIEWDHKRKCWSKEMAPETNARMCLETLFEMTREWAESQKYSIMHIIEYPSYWQEMACWVQDRSEYFSPDARKIFAEMKKNFTINHNILLM